MPRGNNNRLKAQHCAKEQRLEIVAPLWRRNYNYREIRAEVMKRLDLPSYSLQTVKRDVDALLKEWKENRLEDTDKRISSELARIDLVIKEAWEMWEKSKEDYEKKKAKQKGIPKTDDQGVQVGVVTTYQEMQNEEYRARGDARYLDIIIRCIERRCRLLGLDRESIDVNLAAQGKVEIVYRDAGVSCATGEEEVRQREGL